MLYALQVAEKNIMVVLKLKQQKMTKFTQLNLT